MIKLIAFAVTLVAVFGFAFLAGTQSQALIEPISEHQEATEVTGAESSRDGYTLTLAASTAAAAGKDLPVRFTLDGPDGKPVTAFDPVDGSLVHLVAVRRDLTGYQHLTPAADGTTWSVPLDLTPGPWRIVVTFDPAAGDAEVVLGTDLDVAGDFRPEPLPAQATTARVDGYTVRLAGEFATGPESDLRVEVSRDGRPVTDLQPLPEYYLHAVAIRAKDFGYLHLHADKATTPGPELPIGGSAPGRDVYRLFVEFQHQGRQHTAEFTVEARR